MFKLQLWSVSFVGVALEPKRVVETNLIRVSYYCISHFIHFNSSLKKLYISNKTERFSCKGGCGGHERASVEALKRRAGLGYR